MKKVLLFVLLIFLMILISCELKKDSTDVVTPGEETINVTTPLEGDTLIVGSSFEIKWTSTTSKNINIDFTSDNTKTWTSIVKNIADEGNYIWDPIPNKVSNQCRVKVSTTDNSVSDISTGLFTIAQPAAKSIVLDAPNGDEVLIVGKEFEIKWTSASIQNIKIEFSYDNGSTWNTIVGSFPADSGSYLWSPIPNSTSTQCLVKITDVSSSTVTDVSNKVFTISVPKVINITAPNGGESWTGNTSQTITWNSSEVENVKIEYTINNGVSWSIISASTPSDGYFTWDPVPNIPSTNAKVRITNAEGGFPSDESDAVFSIEPELFITVLSPNGKEEWLSGSGHYIKWTTSTPDGGGALASAITNPEVNDAKSSKIKKVNSKNSLAKNKSSHDGLKSSSDKKGDAIRSITSVKIEYSTNNGGSWYTITESTPNTGNFVWNPLPVHNSVLCVIRISDAADGVPFDISDQSFTISQYPTVDIVVSSPNGGEEWNSGTTQTIAWNSQGITSVDIDYSTNNGVDWISIEKNVPSSGYYTWSQVPNTSSNNCKVKISNSASGVPFDESNGTFSILPEPGITVKAPNGNETLQTGTSNNISWVSENVENVKIELTTNNGASWAVIEASTPSDGNYTWSTIPDINSSLCKIRISDAKDGIPSDLSDEVFSISNQIEQSIQMLIPNGGEIWEANTSKLLSWSSNGIDSIKIQFSSNNGITWQTITERTENTGSFDWTVPNINSTQAKIKISDAKDGDPIDESNGTFTVKQAGYLKILKPESGEVWVSGDLNKIEWEAQNVEKIKIEVTSTDAIYDPKASFFDDEWFTLTEDAPGAAGFYETRLTTVSNSYRIRISDSQSDSPADFSGLFSVKARPVKDLVVLSPNGNEKLFAGSSYSIKWTSASVQFVDIMFTTNNGATWTSIADSTESDGLYTWSSVPQVSSSLCKIRILDHENDQFFDESDANFEIVHLNQMISVTAPNGSESWEAGSTQKITWQTTGVENVKIELTTNNGIDWSTIVESTASDGDYTWTQVPSSSSTNCKIKISDAADGMPSDDSDNFFTIAPEPGLTVLSPNGGESYLTGTSTTVTWTSTNVANVKIEYTTNGGAAWTTIVESTPSNGSYLWSNIPDLNSSLCQVKISDANDGSPFDLSNSYFNITNQLEQSIEVLVPNGSEVWEANTSKLLSWRSSGIDSVKIQYSSNNGITWQIITTKIENTGSFDWTVPNINSTQAKVKISDAKDGNPSDESNGTFTIKQAGYLKILKPESGDVWVSGDLNKIEWEAQNIEKIKIEVTTTDAIYDPNATYFDDNWYTLTENAPGASGFYETRFTTPSNLYRVRISDSQTDSPADFSGLFTVKAKLVTSISVLSPNGNEKLYAGSSYSIKWTSANVQFVDIQYTTNNGATWTTIVENTESDGIYTWSSVPLLSSSLCKVRIIDHSNNQYFDESDQNFEIIHQNQMLSVTSPNGSESWEAGSTQKITWQTTGVENVKIELTTNNGIDWSTIIASTPSDGDYTWTQVPSSSSTNCKIKISDAADGMPSDDSDDFFTIAPEPGLIVLSPNGGESYLTGTSTSITWTSTNVANVKIEYTTNGGAAWTTIVASTPSNGSYLWASIPDLNSSLCQVKISDAADGAPYDVSDSYFVITNQVEQTLSLLFPNGGEVFEAGTTQNITWKGTGVSKVSLDFTTNNGFTWTSIANNIENAGALEWKIDVTINSPQCKIRVKDAADNTPTDESNGTFTVKPAQKIEVTNPTAGQVYKAGDEILIQWVATGIENVGIRYTTTNGLGSSIEPSFYTLTSSTPNSGEYKSSFSIPSNQYYVEVYDASDGAPTKRSTGNFTILPQVTNEIIVVKPDGGEDLLINQTHEIQWTSSGVENVKLEVTLNGGATWQTIKSSVPSNGSYNWTVGQLESGSFDYRSDNCKLRISDVNSVSIFDESNGFFTIHPLTKYVRLISPNGGESWDYDNSQLILWTSAGVNFVDIEVSYNNGQTWEQIVAHYPSVGAYEWVLPQVASNLSRIRITDSENASYKDISDSYFQIDNYEDAARPFIKLVQPVSYITLPAGANYNIIWSNSQIITSMDIEYSLDNGVTWNTIALGINTVPWTQNLTQTWAVPNVITTVGRLRFTAYDINALQVFQMVSDPFKIN